MFLRIDRTENAGCLSFRNSTSFVVTGFPCVLEYTLFFHFGMRGVHILVGANIHMRIPFGNTRLKLVAQACSTVLTGW